MFDAILDLLNWMDQTVSLVTDWLLTALLYPFRWFWWQVLETLLEAVGGIELPDSVNSLPGLASSLPCEFLWIADVMELQFGLGVVIASLIARFFLRRIPFIGG